jgi:hypothetical protein
MFGSKKQTPTRQKPRKPRGGAERIGVPVGVPVGFTRTIIRASILVLAALSPALSCGETVSLNQRCVTSPITCAAVDKLLR